jgi:hypothetical protein
MLVATALQPVVGRAVAGFRAGVRGRVSPHIEKRRYAADILRYHSEALMTDILIRDVPEEVLAAIDAKAKRMGLSRTEYLRRALDRERTPSVAVTVEHLGRAATLAEDLSDPEVMRGAWS